MEQPTPKPKPRRKLSKIQITEILERNVALYKDDEQFVHYLVELAIYMMEYEYDWSESGVEPPIVKMEKNAGKAPAPATEQVHQAGFSRPVATSQQLKGNKTCPFCGASVGDQLVCPTCRNMTR